MNLKTHSEYPEAMKGIMVLYDKTSIVIPRVSNFDIRLPYLKNIFGIEDKIYLNLFWNSNRLDAPDTFKVYPLSWLLKWQLRSLKNRSQSRSDSFGAKQARKVSSLARWKFINSRLIFFLSKLLHANTAKSLLFNSYNKSLTFLGIARTHMLETLSYAGTILIMMVRINALHWSKQFILKGGFLCPYRS